MSAVYTLEYICHNCRTRYKVDIAFGTEALLWLKCPTCGLNQCNPVKKDPEYALDGYKIENEKLVKE